MSQNPLVRRNTLRKVLMGLNDLSDEVLMVMYQSGRDDAFSALYVRHSAKIYGFLRRRVWNDEKASELYQDVFLKLHRSKLLYDESLPALPWIFSITRSVLNDGLRLEKKFARDGDSPLEDRQPDSESDISSDALALLASLPSSQQRAVQMRYIDENTFAEIATALDTSQGNVRKMISRAVAKLKIASKKGNAK
jgi:RNA polymerase sigma-70 factor (ECF subfamily)